MNVLQQLEYELDFYGIAVKHVCPYATETPPCMWMCMFELRMIRKYRT